MGGEKRDGGMGVCTCVCVCVKGGVGPGRGLIGKSGQSLPPVPGEEPSKPLVLISLAMCVCVNVCSVCVCVPVCVSECAERV